MENLDLYNDEILENLNEKTKIKLSLEIQNDDDENRFEICLINFPISIYKRSTIYKAINF